MRPTTTSPTLNEDDFVDSIADGDYIFVVDAKGNLKSVLLPEDTMMETPDRVQKVMNIFGISEFVNETVH
jgi:hypothetical protein